MSKQKKLFGFLTKIVIDKLIDHIIAVTESNIQPTPNPNNSTTHIFITQHICFTTNTIVYYNSNTIDFFLYLADSKLISYLTQSSLISDHFAILFYLNLPMIQINRTHR